MSFAAASVPIGGYSLEVGTQSGSFARFEPEEEGKNAQALAAALEEEREEHPAVAAIEEFEASGDAVTGRIEHAEGLLRAAAEGKLLDPAKLTGEVDSLLELLGRLDKTGRFDEELKLMRSLNGLLALSLRWYELVRSLRSLLGSATKHKAAQAFAHHELGSLHLCAGQEREALEHLEEALRIEEQLGDLAGRCATRHNLDAARRELAARGLKPPHRLARLALVAALFVGLGAGGTSIAFGIGGGGTGGGTTASAAFRVEQDFAPDNPRGSISVSVSCTEGGVPDAGPKPASETAPAVFAISSFGAGATCSATARRTPTGYTTDMSGCRNVPITDNGSSSCTITSTRRKAGSATFTVTKDFQPGNEAAVSISVTCTKGGRPDASPKPASEGAPAVFTIKGFRPGATCSATEATPAGYTSNEGDCRSLAIAQKRSCTITNTLNSTTFSVGRTFTDGNASSIAVSLACDSGTVEPPNATAREGSPAAFTVTGYTAGATCTATTVKAPSGYQRNESACQGVPVDAGECTIVFAAPK